ncbi:MAG: hypothetical protein QOJ99_664 [Bryobacterales bacterium]|nr:hypothetical protein [Bryobacterales bacterium]
MALLCFTLVAAAADVTGKWTAESPGRNGTPQVTTFEFKPEGAKLEGSVTSTRGGNPMTTPITDGKVDGDTISFSQTLTMQGNEVKLTYTGKVKGDTIELTREGGRGPQTMTAKKAQ